MLANFFIQSAARGKGPRELSPEAVSRLESYPWPGNVRELEKCINSAIILADGNKITIDDIGLNAVQDEGELRLDLRQVREEAEKRVVITALGRADGTVHRAAEMLGVSRPTLYDLMHRFGMK